MKCDTLKSTARKFLYFVFINIRQLYLLNLVRGYTRSYTKVPGMRHKMLFSIMFSYYYGNRNSWWVDNAVALVLLGYEVNSTTHRNLNKTNLCP